MPEAEAVVEEDLEAEAVVVELEAVVELLDTLVEVEAEALTEVVEVAAPLSAQKSPSTRQARFSTTSTLLLTATGAALAAVAKRARTGKREYIVVKDWVGWVRMSYRGVGGEIGRVVGGGG